MGRVDSIQAQLSTPRPVGREINPNKRQDENKYWDSAKPQPAATGPPSEDRYHGANKRANDDPYQTLLARDFACLEVRRNEGRHWGEDLRKDFLAVGLRRHPTMPTFVSIKAPMKATN